MKTLLRHLLRDLTQNTAIAISVYVAVGFGLALVHPLLREALTLLGNAGYARGLVETALIYGDLFLVGLGATSAFRAYGRTAAAGLIDRRPRSLHPLRPALGLGLLAALTVIPLHIEIAPAARLRREALFTRDFGATIDRLLDREAVEFADARFRLKARGDRDAEGRPMLRDVLIIEDRGSDREPRRIRARTATPHFVPEQGRLDLFLRGLDYDGVLASEELTISMNPEAILAERRATPPAEPGSRGTILRVIAAALAPLLGAVCGLSFGRLRG